MRKIICRRCGAQTWTAGRNAKYCPACRETVKYVYDRKRTEPQKDAGIVQAAQAARAAGLTYGQWEGRQWLERQKWAEG